MNAITGLAGKIGAKIMKHSPEILAVAGTAGVIATAITASKATLKLEETVEPHVKDLARVKAAVEEGRSGYTEQDALSDKTKLYTRIVVDVAKLYGPTIVLGALTIASFWGGNRIQAKRNAGLTAAYAVLNQAYTRLRDKVKNEYGEETLAKLESVDRAEIEDVTGQEAEHVDMGENGVRMKNPYCQIFGQKNPNWSADPWYASNFLRMVESHCNDMLKARGHLFLNEVYDALGMERTPAGAVTGWVLGEGDNYVDFAFEEGRYEVETWLHGNHRIVNEYLINPNVQGPIWDRI